MKRFLLAIAVLLVLGVTLFQYGGRVLTQRLRVVDYKWKLPPEKGDVLSDGLAVEGIQQALLASTRDPANWQPVPITPEAMERVLRKGNNPNAGLVILSDKNSASQLYARVELDPANRSLAVTVSRPK